MLQNSLREKIQIRKIKFIKMMLTGNKLQRKLYGPEKIRDKELNLRGRENYETSNII